MEITLVLSGGAARGAFHLGALSFFEAQDITIKTYSGSSIGAIIAVSHSCGLKSKEQLKLFKSKELKETLRFNYFKKGLLKIDKTHKIIEELIPIKKLEDLPTEVFVNAYDCKNKKMRYFNKGDSHTLCMASAALIPLFSPISYENMNLIDGGLVDNIPIRPILKRKEPILSIDLMPRENTIKSQKRKNRFTLNPIKIVKRKIFAPLHKNLNFSIHHSDYYLTSLKLKEFNMYTFNELNDCFNLGFKEAKKYYLDIIA